MRLLERTQQRAQLDALLAQVVQGRGHVVAISGEAGAGKSALVQDFIQSTESAARILRGACEDLSTPDPLGPLNDLARDAYPGKVVSIRREGDHWRVRMDEGGTVFNVLVNADNGTVNRPSE